MHPYLVHDGAFLPFAKAMIDSLVEPVSEWDLECLDGPRPGK